MSLIAALVALVLVFVEAYLVFAQHHQGPLYVVALILSVLILLLLIVPYGVGHRGL